MKLQERLAKPPIVAFMLSFVIVKQIFLIELTRNLTTVANRRGKTD